MIPIVENLLTEVIETRLKDIRDNKDIVDRIFSQTTITMRNRLKEYISSDNIRVVRGFPNDRANLPCYAIMLGGEREQEKAIGSVFADTSDDDSYEVLNTVEQKQVTKRDGKFIIQVTHKPIEVVTSLTHNGFPLDFEVLDANRGFVLVTGDVSLNDTLEVNYLHRTSGYENGYGSLFNTQYRVETWTNNGDLTVMLYHLLKWMFLSSRDYLESKGLAVQTLGGLDFEPAPEYFPEFVYRRALTFECITENSFGIEFDYIQDIEISGN